MITFEIIDDLEEINGYYSEVDRMFDAGPYEASLSVEWTEALRKTHLGGAAYLLIVLRDSAEIVGIVPLCLREIKKYGLSLKTLAPIAEYFNTHSDLLLRRPSEEMIEVFLRALFSLKYKWDIFRINRFIENCPTLGSITHLLENKSGLNYEIKRAEPSFFIKLDGNYNEFLKKKSANFRYKLKNASKRMHTMGNISFSGEQDFKDFDELYDIILSIEEESWKHKHGTAITSSEKQHRFYKELFGGAFEKKRLRLCLLCLNKEPIAFDAGLVKDKKYYCVHSSYNEKFKEGNPGTMLLAWFIEKLIRDGIEEYDWFGEPFEWESRWTDKFRWHKSLLLYNGTPKAKLFYVFNRLRNRSTNKVRNQIVLRNPRDIRPASS